MGNENEPVLPIDPFNVFATLKAWQRISRKNITGWEMDTYKIARLQVENPDLPKERIEGLETQAVVRAYRTGVQSSKMREAVIGTLEKLDVDTPEFAETLDQLKQIHADNLNSLEDIKNNLLELPKYRRPKNL